MKKMMKNKTKRKILEVENEIKELREKDNCECYMINHLQERINEYYGIESKDTYDPDFDFDAYMNSLEFLYEKETTLWNPMRGEYQATVKFYKCPKCGKPFNLESTIAFA